MEFDFDPAKDAINRAKHGLSLADAVRLDWKNAVIWPDTRFDYGEARMSALSHIGTRLYFVAFVDRGQMRRVITFRKANKKEFKRYVRDLEKRHETADAD